MSSHRPLGARVASLALLALSPLAAVAQTFTNTTSLTGTWSSGNGFVITGPAFAQPSQYTFGAPPQNTGISYSFTDDGFFEEAQYRYVSNGTQPRCCKAILIFQHGTYKILPNNSISLTPWAADGRIQVEDPCAAQTSILTYYNEPTLFLNWGVSIDTNHQAWMLQLARFDGALLPRLFLKYRPPNMNPTQQLSSNGTQTPTTPARL